MMASNTSNNNDRSNAERSQDAASNPFVKFKAHVDNQIGLVLKGMQSIIGLPSTFSKSSTGTTTQWAEWDDHLRRRDALQQRQKELRESEAAKSTATDEEEETVVQNQFPRSWHTPPQPTKHDLFEEQNPVTDLYLALSALSSLSTSSLTQAFREDYIFPYVLLSPYSPLALNFRPPITSIGFEAQSVTAEFPYQAAFEDLLLASRGQAMRPLEFISTAQNNPYRNMWRLAKLAFDGDGMIDGERDRRFETLPFSARFCLAQLDPSDSNSHATAPAHVERSAEQGEAADIPGAAFPNDSETELDLVDYITGLQRGQHQHSIFDQIEALMGYENPRRCTTKECRQYDDTEKTRSTATQTEPLADRSRLSSMEAGNGIGRFVFEHLNRIQEIERGISSTTRADSSHDWVDDFDEPTQSERQYVSRMQQKPHESPHSERDAAGFARSHHALNGHELTGKPECIRTTTTTTEESQSNDGAREKRVVVQRTYADGRITVTETVTTDSPSGKSHEVRGQLREDDFIPEFDFLAFLADDAERQIGRRADWNTVPHEAKEAEKRDTGKSNGSHQSPRQPEKRSGWFWE